MATFNEKINELDSKITAESTQVQNKIAELQERIENGELTPEQEAAFNEAIAKVEGIYEETQPEEETDEETEAAV